MGSTLVSQGKAICWIMAAALLGKAAGSAFQLYRNFELKGGSGDVSIYHPVGQYVAEGLRHLEFDRAIATFELGTGFVSMVTGILYFVIGPTLYGGALVFALLAVVGSFFYYKAFGVAFPQGNKVLFALLVFLYPSLLYWPSLQGKDALLVFCIGLFAYGLALQLRVGGVKGMILLGLGIAGVLLIRTHIAAMLMVPAGMAIAVRSFSSGHLSLPSRVAMLVIMAGLCWWTISNTADFLELDSLSLAATLEYYDERLEDGFGGGSAYHPPSLTDPLGFPKQVITVLFRPFPWETHSLEALVLSLEGAGLLALTIWRFSGLRHAIASVRSDPFLLFILLYILIFMLVFMSISNFSILGRQRLMMLPFFFMLLTYPMAPKAALPAKVGRFSRRTEIYES